MQKARTVTSGQHPQLGIHEAEGPNGQERHPGRRSFQPQLLPLSRHATGGPCSVSVSRPWPERQEGKEGGLFAFASGDGIVAED